MTIGRIFPLQNPLRSFPVDPSQHGDTERDAPLPFQLGAGASQDIETLYLVRPLFSSVINAIENPDDPTLGVTGVVCSPINNQWCVPRGTITKIDSPVGTIRCSIV